MHEPGEDSGLFIDAVEEVTFIGYPNGIRDPHNLTPIVRRGITATPLELDYGMKPAFLVDGAVFGGSSGSPVFLISNGLYRISEDEFNSGGVRILVGVMAAVHTRSDEHPVETVASSQHVRVARELHLGVAYNGRAIRETIDRLFAPIE